MDRRQGTQAGLAFAVLMPGGQTNPGIGFAKLIPAAQFWKENSSIMLSPRFRDAAGAQWHYRSDGQLNEEPDNSSPESGNDDEQKHPNEPVQAWSSCLPDQYHGSRGN
jgi:hypothetical protein